MTSPVWRYFDKIDGNAYCKLCKDKDTDFNLTGCIASNAKKHLKHHHETEHALLLAEEAEKSPPKKKAKTLQQPKIDSVFRQPTSERFI